MIKCITLLTVLTVLTLFSGCGSFDGFGLFGNDEDPYIDVSQYDLREIADQVRVVMQSGYTLEDKKIAFEILHDNAQLMITKYFLQEEINRIDEKIVARDSAPDSPTIVTDNTDVPEGDYVEIPGMRYKWENGKRYQAHSHKGQTKWIQVSSDGAQMPHSTRELWKAVSDNTGKPVYLEGYDYRGKIEKVTANGIEGRRGSDHTNGGRSHFWFNQHFDGPVTVLVYLKDGTVLTRNVPDGRRRWES